MNTIKGNCLNTIKSQWLASSNLFPEFLSEISNEIKMQNELYIQTVLNDIQKQLKIFPRFPIGRKKWTKKTQDILNNILNEETIIGIHHSMDQQTLDSFQEELKDFLRHVRKFAPELSFAEIGQAIRNYTLYVMLKEIHQTKSGFHMVCFGYSMLYPFTDNYIDSIQYTDKQKLEYNQIIRDKLEGKEVHPTSLHQQKTCDLLQAIETEYPRDNNSTIFMLLLMMLEAQEESIRQQKKGFSLTCEERLDISLYKGGISVLIDRFFINKEITEADLNFYLGFGFFLQLVDDLQDIKEDSEQGNQTIFTVDFQSEQEESIVNKILHFIHNLMTTYQAENDIFKNFILSNCYQLIYSSIIGSKEFFSDEYIDQLENYLPITYPFLENMKKNQMDHTDFKLHNKYMKILDELIL